MPTKLAVLFAGLLLAACDTDKPFDQSGDPISPARFVFKMNLCVERNDMETRNETLRQCARWAWACSDHYHSYIYELENAGYSRSEARAALESCKEVHHPINFEPEAGFIDGRPQGGVCPTTEEELMASGHTKQEAHAKLEMCNQYFESLNRDEP